MYIINPAHVYPVLGRHGPAIGPNASYGLYGMMLCVGAQKLSRELGELYARRLLDGFNLWMYGVVLRDLLPSPTPPAAAQAHQRPRQALILASFPLSPLASPHLLANLLCPCPSQLTMPPRSNLPPH